MATDLSTHQLFDLESTNNIFGRFFSIINWWQYKNSETFYPLAMNQLNFGLSIFRDYIVVFVVDSLNISLDLLMD